MCIKKWQDYKYNTCTCSFPSTLRITTFSSLESKTRQRVVSPVVFNAAHYIYSVYL